MVVHLWSYSFFQACAFLVVRSHIQTQYNTNIQFGSQTEGAYLVGMKRVNNPLSVELYKQRGLHRKPHHLMLQNNRLL